MESGLRPVNAASPTAQCRIVPAAAAQEQHGGTTAQQCLWHCILAMSEGLSFHYHQYGSLSRPYEAQRNGKKLLADLVQLATVALCLSAALTWGGQQPPLRQLNGSWTIEPCQNPTPR